MSITTLSRRVDQMRASDSVWTRSLWNAVLAVAAIGLTAANGAAATVNLVAAPVTKAVTLPNGTTVSVPMWGYALNTIEGIPDCSAASLATVTVAVPGPRITVPPGDPTVTINLLNCLPEATSLVIPGQPFTPPPFPVKTGNRVRSITQEATANGGTSSYDFGSILTPLKPGTFLYQSGSHPAVQVQMGLYGAMTKDAADAVAAVPPSEGTPGSPAIPAQAYAGISYAYDPVLVYSEIDPALHEAVNAGTYGTPPGPTSTIDYRPSLFLINGESYSNETVAAMAAGAAGETTLLRILNAGLRTHAPVLDNGSLKIVAEDGNPLPYAKDQAAVLLAAGKTHDALWVPAAAGVYSLYDRTLSLNAPGQGSAGMMAKLRIGASGSSPAPDPLAPVAIDDMVSGVENTPGIQGSVLANDTNAPTAELLTNPHAGTLSFGTRGRFSYTPNPNFFGVDSFTYRAVNGTLVSAPAQVTITVTAVPNAPVANGLAVGVDAGGNVSVTLSASDADGDILKYYLTSMPTNGTLSYIDPLSKVETSVGTLNLRGGAEELALPGGVVIYTPAPGYPTAPATVGPDSFNFVASDGSLASSAATVSATVYAVESASDAARTRTVSLDVRGAAGGAGGPGAPVTAYRWTLEEDLTYKVVPGVADPNTLAVRFHKSYMPVVDAGNESKAIVVDPAKRYFVSVLPTGTDYSNSGAEVEAGDLDVTVPITVAKLPLPTARIRVRVFQDNEPLNGMWDSTEPGLAGFQVTIDDAGGPTGCPEAISPPTPSATSSARPTCPVLCLRWRMSLRCDPTVPAQLGDGFVLSDADGYAVIENLVMGKYTVKVRAPGGDKWIQTSTIEGTPGIDAWVKPNEPQFFTEFGPPGPHVEVGFTRALTGAGVLGVGPANTLSTINGRVTNLRQSRPIEVAQFSGAPFNHTRAWVALNSGATGGACSMRSRRTRTGRSRSRVFRRAATS